MVEIVWLFDYRRPAVLISRGAYQSRVLYKGDDGELYEEYVENDDYEFWEEKLDYEHD